MNNSRQRPTLGEGTLQNPQTVARRSHKGPHGKIAGAKIKYPSVTYRVSVACLVVDEILWWGSKPKKALVMAGNSDAFQSRRAVIGRSSRSREPIQLKLCLICSDRIRTNHVL